MLRVGTRFSFNYTDIFLFEEILPVQLSWIHLQRHWLKTTTWEQLNIKKFQIMIQSLTVQFQLKKRGRIIIQWYTNFQLKKREDDVLQISVSQTSLYLKHLSISNISPSQTSLHLKHPSISNIPLSQTSLYLKHLSISNISLCLLYTSPSPRDATLSRMPSSA